MNDTIAIPPTPPPGPPPAISAGRRSVRRAGWFLAAATSLATGLISLVPITSQSGLLIFGSLALLLAIGMLVAAGLLIGGYHEFFGRGRGVAVWMVIFIISVYLTSEAIPPGLSRFMSAVLTVITFWGFVAALAIGPTLLLYLIRTDRSVVVFAVTYLLLVWLMFSLGQYLGWDVMLRRLVFGAPGEILWPVQGLLCGGIWVTVTAAVAFVWNTVVYICRERAGVRHAEPATQTQENGTL